MNKSYLQGVRRGVGAKKLVPTELKAVRVPQGSSDLDRTTRKTWSGALWMGSAVLGLVGAGFFMFSSAQANYPIRFDSVLSSFNPSSEEVLPTTPSGLRKIGYSPLEQSYATRKTFSDKELQEQSALVNWYGRRYRISRQLLASILRESYASAEHYELDPHLVIAIISVESSFNPYAESKVGAKGLMQILPTAHPEKLIKYESEEVLLYPAVNIQVGSQVLRQYLRELGSIELALKKYVGSINQETDKGYGAKVLEEQARIKMLLGQESRQIAMN